MNMNISFMSFVGLTSMTRGRQESSKFFGDFSFLRTPKGRARRAYLASVSAATSSDFSTKLCLYFVLKGLLYNSMFCFQVQKSFGKQLKQLAKRELRAVVRDRTTLAVRQTWPTQIM